MTFLFVKIQWLQIMIEFSSKFIKLSASYVHRFLILVRQSGPLVDVRWRVTKSLEGVERKTVDGQIDELLRIL